MPIKQRSPLPLPSHLLYTVGSGFLLSFLLIIAMSLTGLSALEENNQRLARITDEVMEKTLHANVMRDTLRDRALTMHDIFVTREAFTREQLVQHFYQLGGVYLAIRPKLEAYPLNAEEKAILTRLDRLTLENQPLMIQIINLAIENQEEKASHLLQTQELPRQQALVATLDDLIQAQQKIARQATLEAEQTYAHTRNLMFFLGLMALLLAGTIAALILKRVQRLASEIERARNRYQTLFETNSEGIVIMGNNGFIGCNQAALELFGYPDEAHFVIQRAEDLGSDPQPGGRPASEVVAEATATAFAQDHAYMAWEARRADGSLFPAEIALHAMRFEGQPTLQAIVRDLTLEKEAEQALHAAHAAELATATLKTQFIANISHEIRTPMNGVLGMADLLQRQPLTPEQASYVRAINDSAQTLLGVLNDLLDFSKLTAGRMTIEQIAFDLPALIRSVSQLPRHLAETAGLQFHLDQPDTLPHWVTGDPLRLRQILTNLLDNALKFTRQGSVTLRVEQAHPDDPHHLLFSVCDTGIGVPDDARTQIFEAFIQADGSVSRQFGGTGLGLTICRELADLMGGRLWVDKPAADNPTPTGSCFYLDIRLDAALASDIPGHDHHDAPLAHFNGARILVAEDHPVNQLLIREMLSQLGAIPTLASDGQAAFAAYCDAEASFDLILMDYQMPVWDGLRATREIRALEASEGWARCPILALTAATLTERQDTLAEDWRSAGMDGYLGKPITSARLAAALADWLTPEPLPAPATTNTHPIPSDPTQLVQHPAAILEMFMETTTTDLFQLVEHLEHEQHEEAIRLAHRISGAAAFVGATTLAKQARSLEKTLKEGVAHNESELNALHTHFSFIKKSIEARLNESARG